MCCVSSGYQCALQIKIIKHHTQLADFKPTLITEHLCLFIFFVCRAGTKSPYKQFISLVRTMDRRTTSLKQPTSFDFFWACYIAALINELKILYSPPYVGLLENTHEKRPYRTLIIMGKILSITKACRGLGIIWNQLLSL